MDAAMTADQADWQESDGGRVGIWLFIVSEILLFGAFLASYAATRLGSADCALGVTAWPEAGHAPGLRMAAINTVVLLTSSFTMVRAVGRAKAGDLAGVRRFLAATVTLGASFLLIKGLEYSLKISLSYYPGSDLVKSWAGLSIFLSYYYLLTILHGLHVVAGLVWLLVLRSAAGKLDGEALARKAELAGLYWHFVDVVWVFLFPLLYLI